MRACLHLSGRLFVAALLCGGLTVGDEIDDGEISEILVLDGMGLEEFKSVTGNGNWLIKFYAPWCKVKYLPWH